MARNLFASEFAQGNWVPAAQAGINSANAFDDRIRSRRASTRAAPMIASGDYQGAAGVYGEAGLVDETAALEGQARTRQRQGMADQQAAMTAEQEAVKAQFDNLRAIMQDLAQVPQGQRLGAWRRRAAELVAQGYPQEAVESQTEADLTDAELQAFGAKIAEAEQYTLPPGSIRFDAKGNKVAEAPFAPEKPLVLAPERVAIMPSTGEVVGRGGPKTFAPQRPSSGGASSGGRSLGAQLPEGY
jgi:hypothetical protein